MIPLWKLRRELYRFGEYLWAGAGLIYEPFLKARHDRWRRALPAPADQDVPASDKIAILLAFQPKGIAASTILTLSHLAQNGYAPLLISNAPLSKTDRAKLASVTWRVIERPNYGYDFGGYRDGILLLEDWGIRPKRLFMMNDSIWFPLAAGSTLLDRLENTKGDIVGGFLHPDTVRKRTGTIREGFLESYLYLINQSALEHAEFKHFWQRFRVSSNKLNAVYRGERGFSREMKKRGLSITGLFTPDGLLQALETAPDETVRLTLTYGAYMDADLAAEQKNLMSRDISEPNWRKDALDHITHTIARRRFNASFPYPSVALLGMDFMKKSLGPTGAGALALHSQMRAQYLNAAEANDVPPPMLEILTEMKARQSTLSTD